MDATLETLRGALYEVGQPSWELILALALTTDLDPLALDYLVDHLAQSRDLWRARIQGLPAPWFGPRPGALAERILGALGWGEAPPSWREVPLSLVFPGEFLMGAPPHEKGAFDNESQRAERITRAFWVQRTPITQRAWTELDGQNPSHFKQVGGDAPVECVAWADAARFANLMCERDGFPPSYVLPDDGGEKNPDQIVWTRPDQGGWRMPTAAEWEYACRAGTETATYAGDLAFPTQHDPTLDRISWYKHNSQNTTQPVGLKEPNAWGLYDTLGNMYEWCWDARSQLGQATSRATRGGAWCDQGRGLRAGFAGFNEPKGRHNFQGARMVRTAARFPAVEGEDLRRLAQTGRWP